MNAIFVNCPFVYTADIVMFDIHANFTISLLSFTYYLLIIQNVYIQYT